MTHVSVLVCTRERPTELERCARSLAHLRFPHHPHTTVDLVVVDNTPGGTPGLDPHHLATLAGHPTRVVHEPVTGIAPARNTALDHRHPHAHHVAFLDDDETATPTWLDHLLTTAHTHHADLVAGPALVRLPDEIDPVVAAWHRLHRGGRVPTGTTLPAAATCNLLIRVALLDAHPDLRFDHRLGLTGGEDVDWTVRARERGARIVWADRALVWEWIPPARATRAGIRRQATSWGATAERCATPLGRRSGLADTLAELGGALMCPAGDDRHERAAARRHATAWAWGRVRSRLGRAPRTYRRVTAETLRRLVVAPTPTGAADTPGGTT